MKFGTNFTAILLFGGLLAGCGEPARSIYYWDGALQTSLYEYLIDEYEPQAQIAKLQDSLQKIYETNSAVPPGLYAHLGLLYSNLGNTAQANAYFGKEVQSFPEAKAYIAFLLSQKDKKAKK